MSKNSNLWCLARASILCVRTKFSDGFLNNVVKCGLYHTVRCLACYFRIYRSVSNLIKASIAMGKREIWNAHVWSLKWIINKKVENFVSSSLGSSGAVERWWKKVEEKTFRLLLWTALIEMCASPTERKRVLDRASGMCLIMNQRNHIIYTQFIFIYKFEYKYISIPRRAIHFSYWSCDETVIVNRIMCVCLCTRHPLAQTRSHIKTADFLCSWPRSDFKIE